MEPCTYFVLGKSETKMFVESRLPVHRDQVVSPCQMVVDWISCTMYYIHRYYEMNVLYNSNFKLLTFIIGALLLPIVQPLTLTLQYKEMFLAYMASWKYSCNNAENLIVWTSEGSCR